MCSNVSHCEFNWIALFICHVIFFFLSLVAAINVKSHVVLKPYRVKKHCVRFNFLSRDAYINEFSVTPKSILRHMREQFFKFMFKAIGKAANEKYST